MITGLAATKVAHAGVSQPATVDMFADVAATPAGKSVPITAFVFSFVENNISRFVTP